MTFPGKNPENSLKNKRKRLTKKEKKQYMTKIFYIDVKNDLFSKSKFNNRTTKNHRHFISQGPSFSSLKHEKEGNRI